MSQILLENSNYSDDTIISIDFIFLLSNELSTRQTIS